MYNLLGHLRTHHAVKHCEVTKVMKAKQTRKTTVSRTDVSIGQSTLKESLEKCQKYERKSKKWKDSTDAVSPDFSFEKTDLDALALIHY